MSAAFEAHAAALEAGLHPHEATSLSVTLAELITYGVEHANGGRAQMRVSPEGFRLEVSSRGGRAPPIGSVVEGGSVTVSGGATVVRYERAP